MDDLLIKRTQEWMQLERKTLEQRKEAERYYDDNMMLLIQEAFIENNRQKIVEKVEFMVISVGTSYEPIVLNLSLTKPAKVLFLYTEKSKKTLEKVVRYCALETYRYEKRMIHETEPYDIYREIKEAYQTWNQPEKMYIDITGGTKAMSATAALAGSIIDVQLLYVGTDDYLVDFRKPNPGSEKLILIDNPLTVFGDIEISEAMAFFGRYNFARAAEKLGSLRMRIPEPNIRQQLDFMYYLARAYEGWDALDFEQAYSSMRQLLLELRRDARLHREFLLVNQADLIEEQKKMLENLRTIPELIKERRQVQILKNRKLIIPLMFTMLQNAFTRAAQEKYDMATLLLYRLLEMIEQRRLIHHNLYASRMEYRLMLYDRRRIQELDGLAAEEKEMWLRKEVERLRSQLFRKYSDFLPEQVSLLDGFLILAALRDPVIPGDGKERIAVLKQIRGRVSLRNNSIFAHGLGPVRPEDYKRFEEFVRELFCHFCRIEKVDYRTMRVNTQWISPLGGRGFAGISTTTNEETAMNNRRKKE